MNPRMVKADADGGNPLSSPDPIPVQPHVQIKCHGCGAKWWADEDCLCFCAAGAKRYEDWEVRE